jgi:NTE family protein
MRKTMRLSDWMTRLFGPRRKLERMRLALGLQGGGALGAFTWGVLDRLLEEPGLPLRSLSGTSAGAVNAVVLAAHWAEGGAEAARAALARLWRRLSEAAPPMPLGHQVGGAAIDIASRLFSPYQLNPLDLNPLRRILAEEVDFEALRGRGCPTVLIAATRISDGATRIFGNDEITLDAVLASAALPQLHHAVEIAGESYWDGGFTANPPLLALAERTRPSDLLVVQLNPIRRDGVPVGAGEITQRLRQLVFNRPLIGEIEALGEKWPRLALHRLAIDPEHGALARGGALTLDWGFLEALQAHGRAVATAWLAATR